MILLLLNFPNQYVALFYHFRFFLKAHYGRFLNYRVPFMPICMKQTANAKEVLSYGPYAFIKMFLHEQDFIVCLITHWKIKPSPTSASSSSSYNWLNAVEVMGVLARKEYAWSSNSLQLRRKSRTYIHVAYILTNKQRTYSPPPSQLLLYLSI